MREDGGYGFQQAVGFRQTHIEKEPAARAVRLDAEGVGRSWRGCRVNRPHLHVTVSVERMQTQVGQVESTGSKIAHMDVWAPEVL
jgi:hypothetical protein